MTPLDEDRPPLTVAMEWTSRVTTVALEMSLPILAGYWLDRQVGTKPWCMVLGAVLGLSTGVWHLIQMTQIPPAKPRDQRQGDPRRPNDEP